jgi:hypothetical protein
VLPSSANVSIFPCALGIYNTFSDAVVSTCRTAITAVIAGLYVAWSACICARHKADLDIEMGAIEPSTRKVQQFPYWRDRILLLRDAYDNAEPRDVKTWWYDKRNRFQRSTVLFAVIVLILTVLFGLIQSVTGIMQVYVAFRTNP